MFNRKTFLILFTKILLIFPIFYLTALPVDLTKEDIYVRKGFSETWVSKIPEGKENWKKIHRVSSGQRALQIPNILKEQVPKRNFLSLQTWKAEEFTFVTKFNLKIDEVQKTKPLGLYLAIIGENWSIYLNGHLIRKEEYINKSGKILYGRNIRRVIVPLVPNILKIGENVLAFKIIGNPTDINTGFFRSKPYKIDSYDKLAEYRFDVLSLVLIFFYLGAGLFHIFLFFLRPKDSYYIYFGFLCICLFLFNFLRSYIASDLIFDSYIVARLEIAAIFALVPFFSALMNTLLKGNPGKFTLFITIYTLIFILLIINTPIPFVTDLLNIWNIITLAIPLPFYFGRICFEYYQTIKSKRKESIKPNLLKASLSSLLKTIPGNLLIGTIVIASCSVFDILNNMFWHTGIVLVRYGFFVFVVGITAVLANRFLDAHRKIEKLNDELENNILDLQNANKKITSSETKYRVLIEGTNDIIFTLDKDWNFLTVNNSAQMHLGLRPNKLISTSLFHLIHTTKIDRKKTIRFLRDKVKEFIETKKPTSFKVNLLSSFNNEPRDFRIYLEYILLDGEEKILGKASRVLEDTLLKYITSEKQIYEIDNYLTLAEDMSRRLVRNLERYMELEEIISLRVSLREIIINAIEHGNLQVSFEDKTMAMVQDNYQEFLKSRQSDPVLGNRKVKIEYILEPNQVIYKIEDEGDGFDHNKIRQNDPDNLNNEMQMHGRGIKMSEDVFDEMLYNEKGNIVTLIKNFT